MIRSVNKHGLLPGAMEILSLQPLTPGRHGYRETESIKGICAITPRLPGRKYSSLETENFESIHAATVRVKQTT